MDSVTCLRTIPTENTFHRAVRMLVTEEYLNNAKALRVTESEDPIPTDLQPLGKFSIPMETGENPTENPGKTLWKRENGF